MYKIVFSEQAKLDLTKLKKSEPNSLKKAEALLLEMVDHPYTGTGKPKPLRNDKSGQLSRKISEKHRLVYQVNDEVVEVLILSAFGHYDDK